MVEFRPGSYRLTTYVTNPESRPNSDDWRHKAFWEAGTVFHGYYRYAGVNREIPAFYEGRQPETAVSEENLPRIYQAIISHLEYAK